MSAAASSLRMSASNSNTGTTPSPLGAAASAPSSSSSFDIVAAYQRALTDEKLRFLPLWSSWRPRLASLGVRAGCQLWERFVALSGGGSERGLIAQGRSFCSVTAPHCRDKIAKQAVDFVRDDCVTILRAHKQHKRVSVYVTEARPGCLGMKTHELLTEAGIPCTVILDSAVGYVMERVDMVLLGCEAVVESGALVSSVGTYQVALVAKAMQKPVYALAESYKFLRHYPLSQTDLPMPRTEKRVPLSFPDDELNARKFTTPSRRTSNAGADRDTPATSGVTTPLLAGREQPKMSVEMQNNQPNFDVTYPELVDFIITDLGTPLSPTSVSQYLVAQFSE
ncbi:hypothetical protein A1Q2_00305 [Trichosporon asahii var. asahii CBS 8904]|uniref:Uncharacterized protein n=1 Tax=Trichosporon asahii var. asahii (strain CBS 8904) TaxID=1220162 RepID=K1W9A1_TRIAC|nr:hypothetical protein A1Q2_00305 [Trichosporon asahii var. asahii CBS 8904]